MQAESKKDRVGIQEGVTELLADYEHLRNSPNEVTGMLVGLSEVDVLTHGIHPGELAILGGGAKSGKSFFLDRVALKEWERGRNVTLFTLEISIKTVYQRMACMAIGLNPRGLLEPDFFSPEEVSAMEDWVADVLRSDTPLTVVKPQHGKATIEKMVTEARQNESESLIIDQLTFVDHRDPNQKPYLQIKDSLHLLHDMISSGRESIPCLMAHQMNREGKKFAHTNGYYLMDHMSESSEVERTADWAFSIFASADRRAAQAFLLQTLASRRTPLKNWDVSWDPATGIMGVRAEEPLDRI